MPGTKNVAVTRGTQFRSYYADGNPLWEAVEPRGQGVWICEIQAEPVEIDGRTIMVSDYQGARKAFTVEEIRASIAQEAFWKQSADESQVFWNGLAEGDIIHYHSGFNQYVRGVAARNREGTMGLLPVALVGNWRRTDLPRRERDGSIHLPYYARRLVSAFEDAWFQPHASHIFENPHFSQRAGDLDPTELPAIRLSVPEPTPEEAKMQARERLRGAIQEALRSHDVEEALAAVKKLAQQI